MARKTCPDWLDDAGRNEWRRLVGDDRIESELSEVLAVYSFVLSLRLRVRTAVNALRATGRHGPSSAERQGLVNVLTDLDERLTHDLLGLSATLGIEIGEPALQRPTRILILDEGVADTPD